VHLTIGFKRVMRFHKGAITTDPVYPIPLFFKRYVGKFWLRGHATRFVESGRATIYRTRTGTLQPL
jgi:hypothetical protein